MAVELRVLSPSGTDAEILPDWSDLTFSQDLVTAGALTFSYPDSGRHSALLAHGCQLSIRLDGVEPRNGRFYYDEGTGSRIAESGAVSTYAAKSNLARFGKMMLAPAFGSTFADENMFAYTNKTSGELVITAVNNAMSRGNQLANAPAPWLTHPLAGFTTTTDSNGVAWGAGFDVKFAPGSKVSDVTDWLTTNGFAEPAMEGKTLRLFQPSSNGRNLASGPAPVVLQTGRDFTDASYQTSSADLVNALLVLGDTNSCAWVYDTASIAAFGYREGTLTVSNASTTATLTAAGNAYLVSRKIPRWAYTYSVSALYLDRPYGASARPFIDYQVGDSILILDGVATTVQRLRLLSATYPNARASSVALTVNDYFAERDVEFDRRLARLGG